MSPRFYLVVAAPVAHEENPDIPADLTDDGSVIIWDRKHKRQAATFHTGYAQLICLEGQAPEDAPFSHLETWLNSLTPEVMASELPEELQ